MYEVIISLEFKKSFKKLEKKIQDRVRKILEKLQTNLIGEALKGDLQNFYSVHFERNKYRLIYFKQDHRIEILAVHVGKRTNRFYDDFKKELKRSSKEYC